MTPFTRRFTAVLFLALLPFGAGAETFGARVMAPGLLSRLATGEALNFRHSRQILEASPDAAAPKGGYRRLGPLEAETITLRAEEGGQLSLSRDARQLAEFSASSPHPILLMFLENVMRSVAQETGGNPHYIRNRMRTTLGAAVPADTHLEIRPFQDDPHRERYGEFADLLIDIRWAPGAPSRLLRLNATLPEAPERYSETFLSAPVE